MLAAGFLISGSASAQRSGHFVYLPLAVRCGDGSASEDYGFTDDLMQPHWTVGWESYVSEMTVDQVDMVLDDLDYDNIAQTMILVKPAEEVGNRVNCAVHFLRYMKLGQPTGARKDNGFVFLVVVDNGGIDVHYGVGLGLPALTAHGLTDINRLAEDAYDQTGSMDEALLVLVNGFEGYARSKYEPWHPPTPTPEQVALGSSPPAYVVICILCVVALFILFIIFVSIRGAGRRTRRSGPTVYRSPTVSRPRRVTGPRPTRSSRPRSRSRTSVSRPKPRRRGGSGSGRSGRGN